jgi:hypothetical protein
MTIRHRFASALTVAAALLLPLAGMASPARSRPLVGAVPDAGRVSRP